MRREHVGHGAGLRAHRDTAHQARQETLRGITEQGTRHTVRLLGPAAVAGGLGEEHSNIVPPQINITISSPFQGSERRILAFAWGRGGC